MLEESFFEFALPFFLVLVLVYGALHMADVFKNKGVIAIISLIIAFFSISYAPLISLIWAIFPYVAIFLIAFFFLGFIISFFRKQAAKDWPLIAIVCGLLLLLGARFGSSMIEFSYFPISSTNFLMIIGLVILIVIFYAAYKH